MRHGPAGSLYRLSDDPALPLDTSRHIGLTGPEFFGCADSMAVCRHLLSAQGDGLGSPCHTLTIGAQPRALSQTYRYTSTQVGQTKNLAAITAISVS